MEPTFLRAQGAYPLLLIAKFPTGCYLLCTDNELVIRGLSTQFIRSPLVLPGQPAHPSPRVLAIHMAHFSDQGALIATCYSFK